MKTEFSGRVSFLKSERAGDLIYIGDRLLEAELKKFEDKEVRFLVEELE